MKKRILGFVSVSLLVLSGLAMAGGAPKGGGHHGGDSGSGFYIGAGYNFFETESAGLDWDTSTLDLRIGKFFTPNFAVEGRIGIGVSDDTVGGVNNEIDNYIGAFARGQIPINNQFSIYGLAGIVTGDASASATVGGQNVAWDDTNFAWGIGASFALNRMSSIGAEYMNLYDDDGIEIGGFGINYMHKF